MTGTPPVPAIPIPTRNVSASPVSDRATASDDFRGTPEVVTVRPGDTLGHLAARYHVSLAELRELNPELFTDGPDARGRKRAANGHWIYPGDRVRMRPASGQGSSQTSTEALAAQVRAARQASGQDAEPAATKAPEQGAAETASQATVANPEPTQAPRPQAPVATEPAKPEPAKAEPKAAEPPKAEATKTEPKAAEPPKVEAPKTEPKAAEPPKVEAPKTEPKAAEPPKTEPPKAAPKAAEPPAAPAKSANVYAIERYTPRPIPTSPPPMPATMAAGQNLNQKERLILGGLLAGLSLVKLPNSVETSIGNSAVDGILSKSPLYMRNPEIVRYVASVGAKLVNQSDRTDLDWKFYVVDSPQINAFSLPGGHVFITTAALRNLKSEAELAGVLGHEIAHVEKRHGAKTLQKTMLAQGVAIAALGDQSPGVQVAGQLAIGVAMNGYSRGQEDESDARAAELAYRAGYDPKGLLQFFDTLKQAHPDSPEWMAWASDHPRTGDRIERVTQHIAKQGLSAPRESNPDRYRQVMGRM